MYQTYNDIKKVDHWLLQLFSGLSTIVAPVTFMTYAHVAYKKKSVWHDARK